MDTGPEARWISPKSGPLGARPRFGAEVTTCRARLRWKHNRNVPLLARSNYIRLNRPP